MEEVGVQVASPIFVHQTLAGRLSESHPMAKKRSLPIQGTHFQHQQRLPSGFQNPIGNWNPKAWDWDSTRFVAKPLGPDVPRVGTRTSTVQSQPQRSIHDDGSPTNQVVSNSNFVGEDDESLLLKLGGGGLNSGEDLVSRPNKRVRSRSPGGGNYPMCQVDNCKANLSNAKDYHRRHKVCELHSKANKALVGKQMQRFCQQCSRFHPLSEFDEGKRSCRRRLAGHNRRRRKSQPEDVSSQLLLPGNRNNSGDNGDMDIVSLLTVLAHAQGNTEERRTNCSSVPNKDQLMQIINKINSLPLPADLASKLSNSGSLNINGRDQVCLENQNGLAGGNSSASTVDLLAVLSATLASPSLDGAILSQRSSQGSDTEKTKSACLDQVTCFNLPKGAGIEFTPVGERSSTSYQSPVEDSDCHVQDTRANLPLQLFSSSPEDESSSKLASGRKYFSCDSSSPMEDRSPSSSPPVMQTLFPTQTSREQVKPESTSTSGEVTANAKSSRTHGGGITSFDLFGRSSKGADNSSFHSFPYQAGYTSSSGSDHSPSSLNSDAQDRTGRIIFKLFDKDPSHLPGTLRTQIYNWLSHSPSEMESYIRPGCVVLSVYLSMSSSAWEQLEKNLLRHVNSLIQVSDNGFWRSARFLVHTGRQLALHKDGKVQLLKSWKSWNYPELIAVSPLAVVGGQETTLLLKGRNLSTPGNKIHCTHTGGHTLQVVPQSALACHESLSDEICLGRLTIGGAIPSVLGRFFIETENGFRGTSFPVIIADATICQELKLLESEFGDSARMHDATSEDHTLDVGTPSLKEELLHFLNELGWLFQRKGTSSMLEAPDYRISRFKFLFIFSVDRDFTALVKTLLDILLEKCLANDELSSEALEMLLDAHLLLRAVKRRCRNMVDFLIHYSVLRTNDTSRNYIFPPNVAGPGGVTPLHLAACTFGSDDIVDTLTSDPQEIGLQSWSSLLDSNGLSPYAYALMRNNHSYNTLVVRKLADRKNGQVSVSIEDEIEQQSVTVDQGLRHSFRVKQGQKPCSKCAVAAAKYNRRIPGSQGLLHRPYINSMLAIAAVCVCVCLFLRGSPNIGLVAPFKWENLCYGSI